MAAEIPQYIPREQLLPYLPHRGKMFLLSRVTAHSAERRTITAEYDVSTDCIFYDAGLDGVPAWVGFEVMAQAVAVLSSLCLAAQGRLEEAAPGVILSVTGYSSAVAALRAGTTARIEVAEDYGTDSLSRYVCGLYAQPGDDAPTVQATIAVMAMPDMKKVFTK